MSTAFSNRIAYFNFYLNDLHNLVSFNATSYKIISSVIANSTALRIRGIQASGDNLYVFGITLGDSGSDSGSDIGLFSRVHFSNLEKVDTMDTTSILLSEITNSSYELVNVSVITGLSITTEAYADGGLPSNVTDINISITSCSIESDISDTYLNTVRVPKIISGHNHSKVVQIPCSINGTTALYYSLIQNGNESLPDFVIYDDSSFTLTITEPNVTSDTNFTFKILANAST